MDFSPAVVIAAYCQGYFPMALDLNPPLGRRRIYWLDPDPRAIFELETIQVPRRLQRRLKRGEFTVTMDQACAEVIAGCADREETWISPTIRDTYQHLHHLGYVHSVEVWQAGELAGGLYGVAVGGAFCGESMFHRVTDASKVAFFHLVEHLKVRGYMLLDAQLLNDHTASLGATEISREEYHDRLTAALAQNCRFN
ncbi:leucyl/phenylalanyl-tRNA--protein transferase [Candidatus Cyanaurora vandensis]|uniref:leucyl/phenylalanyl-tRNA--protein transferase n=1 Tax=Candidatus Cyanaurora vandensis TaxID=2714958 RepID=UPI00257EDE5F|nr:leucyl/phenylalanyl-tRNA--protein transferase [Candidatus Cyanaurora vandensis]